MGREIWFWFSFRQDEVRWRSGPSPLVRIAHEQGSARMHERANAATETSVAAFANCVSIRVACRIKKWIGIGSGRKVSGGYPQSKGNNFMNRGQPFGSRFVTVPPH